MWRRPSKVHGTAFILYWLIPMPLSMVFALEHYFIVDDIVEILG